MTKDKSILIKNIYYMLAYAFRALKSTQYDSVAAEQFDNIYDLMAAILVKGVSQQRKQGLYREYCPVLERLPTLRGKLDLQGTMENRRRCSQTLSCAFDELTEDNRFHQILKATMAFLVKRQEVKPEHRAELRQLLRLFYEVRDIDPRAISWNTLRYQRSNRTYELLINLCRFVLMGALQTTEQGQYKLPGFTEENMAKLYEKFLLEYYRQEHPKLKVDAMQILWMLDSGAGEYLPRMQTDVTLQTKSGKTLIIDAKYYTYTMLTQYDRATLRSAHLYQIFAYVKNQAYRQPGEVSGLLLYARTEESVQPERWSYAMSGNRIGADTLDLNRDFSEIKKQLDGIVADYLPTQ